MKRHPNPNIGIGYKLPLSLEWTLNRWFHVRGIFIVHKYFKKLTRVKSRPFFSRIIQKKPKF